MKTEFDLIEQLRKRSATSKIGDDCAVIPKDARTDLVLTTDLIVEDVDFRREWMIPQFLGHKALAVSLSDVAAMGAQPVWAMLSIGIPEDIWKTDFVEKLYEGWFTLAKKFDVELVGGDVSKTPDKIVFDSMVAGEVKKGKAVLRSGAKVGDLIFVTGNLGGAALGLELLEAGEGFKNSKFNDSLLRQLKPNAQTEIGKILGEKNLATAMIDLSDGLSSDLAHLCRESRVGAMIFADKIPLNKNLEEFLKLKRHAKTQKSDIENRFKNDLFFALNGGEDFELLFTINPKKKLRLENALKNFTFSCVGEITEDIEGIKLISGDKTQILTARGFRHF